MLTAIISIAVVIGILFLLVAGSCAALIYHGVKKNEQGKKKSFAVFIPSLIAWLALIGVNTALIVTALYKNKDSLLDAATRVPADLVGKGLALTVQSFEKNWDQNRILQLENLRVSPSALEYEQQDGQKIYTVDLVLDNKSPPEIKLYLSDLIGNHYLAVCDAEDFVYPLTVISAGPADTIPFGKNRFRFMATVPESAEITHARFVREKIPLK